jgi:hypothetical protein
MQLAELKRIFISGNSAAVLPFVGEGIAQQGQRICTTIINVKADPFFLKKLLKQHFEKWIR